MAMTASQIAEAIGRDLYRRSSCGRQLPFYQLDDGSCRVDTGAHTQLLYTPTYGSVGCHLLAGHEEPCRFRLPDGRDGARSDLLIGYLGW